MTAFFANLAATFSGELTTESGGQQQAEAPRYLRVIGPMNPETVATYPRRLLINRNSPYSPPKWAEDLTEGLPSFDTRNCTTGIVATLDPSSPEDDAFKERATETKGEGQTAPKTQEENAKLLFERIQQYAFAGQPSTSGIAAPACKQQAPFEPIYGSGPSTQYQHTFEQPNP